MMSIAVVVLPSSSRCWQTFRSGDRQSHRMFVIKCVLGSGALASSGVLSSGPLIDDPRSSAELFGTWE
eukprot:13531574-Alexandrium_andersonii.AAC.1